MSTKSGEIWEYMGIMSWWFAGVEMLEVIKGSRGDKLETRRWWAQRA